jgi:hypothetical protein
MENPGSGDLNRLEKEFRVLEPSCRAVRADWDYIIGSGVSGRYRTAGADPSAIVQCETLIRRAASVALPGVSDLFNGWLDALRSEGINFKFEGEYVEQNADRSDGARHLM